MTFDRSRELYSKAREKLVGGVNSGARAFNAVGGNPLFMQEGQGPYIYDVDGNAYLDYVGSFGPLILGHNPPEVGPEIQKAASRGTTFGASTELEIMLAELVSEAFPAIEMTRFVNSGTEAALSALRLARAYTGRNKVIKFAGCYHGHVDALLAQAGSGVATQGLPGSQGIPESYTQDTFVVPYNDAETVRSLFEQYPQEIAAVAIEPVTGNMGVIKPEEGFLESLRQITREYNALLLFDEVMTGFRYHFGGAQDVYHVQPDLTMLGKVIGGGLPVGAFGGRKEVMQMVSPEGPVYQGGTLSGNPLAMTGGYYTLKTIRDRPELYDHLHRITGQLRDELEKLGKETGVPLQVNQFGSMLCAFFQENPPRNFDEVKRSNTDHFKDYFWALINDGIWIPPSQFEAWFLSTPLQESHIDHTLEASQKALQQLSTQMVSS
jgi:glutamate-1-semialdehyde 2,1-aminomutase